MRESSKFHGFSRLTPRVANRFHREDCARKLFPRNSGNKKPGTKGTGFFRIQTEGSSLTR